MHSATEHGENPEDELNRSERAGTGLEEPDEAPLSFAWPHFEYIGRAGVFRAATGRAQVDCVGFNLPSVLLASGLASSFRQSTKALCQWAEGAVLESQGAGRYPSGAGEIRPPYIHFPVDGRCDRLVTQLYFAGEAENETDRRLNSAPAPERLIATLQQAPPHLASSPYRHVRYRSAERVTFPVAEHRVPTMEVAARPAVGTNVAGNVTRERPRLPCAIEHQFVFAALAQAPRTASCNLRRIG